MHADPRAGGEFGAHAGIVQGDRVVAGLGALAGMAETRGVTAVGHARIAAFDLRFAGHRHQQHIAEVGMAGAREMRMREADDGGVRMAVAGSPSVGILAQLDARVRAELDHAERHRRTGKGMALATGADEGIDRGERSRADFDPGIRGLHTGRDRQHRDREGDPQPVVHAVPQVRLGEAER